MTHLNECRGHPEQKMEQVCGDAVRPLPECSNTPEVAKPRRAYTGHSPTTVSVCVARVTAT